MLRPYTNVRPGLIVKDTRWETRLLALVAAILVVFGLTAVYGASSLLTISGGQGGSSFALKQAVGAAGGGIGATLLGPAGYRRGQRSGEGRVREERRSRWAAYHLKKKKMYAQTAATYSC